MRMLFRLIILISVMILWTSGNLQAATFQIGKKGDVFNRGEVLSAFPNALTIAPGEYNFDINLKALVWQKGRDSHGWEADDRIIIKALLDGALLAEAVESGLDGQNKICDLSLSMDFKVEKKSQLEIEIFSDASSKKERWKVLNADLNGVPLTAVPLPNALFLLVSGLAGLVGLGRMKPKRT